MNNYMKSIIAIAFSIIVLCLSGTVLFAQKASDNIYLKNGDILIGSIVQYSITDDVVIELRNGNELTVPRSAIERVEMSGSKSSSYRKHKEKQWYNQTSLRTLNGLDAVWGDNIMGLGVQNVTGYQYNKWLGLGLGAGYDMYQIDSRQAIIPVFTELRGHVLDGKVSPIYSIAAGIGFGVNNEDNAITKIKPGFMWNPSIGFSVQGKDNSSFIIDLGYQFQYITYIIDGDVWNPNIIRTEQDYHFKRLALRLGLMF